MMEKLFWIIVTIVSVPASMALVWYLADRYFRSLKKEAVGDDDELAAIALEEELMEEEKEESETF